jgi:hypothetical protein
MAIQEFEPQAEPTSNQFRVWTEETPDTYFEVGNSGRWVAHNNFAPTQYFVDLNGQRLGLLHCEVSGNGQEAFVDGVDTEAGLSEEDLSDRDWQSIALCVHGLTQVRRVIHPAGQTPFLEAV